MAVKKKSVPKKKFPAKCTFRLDEKTYNTLQVIEVDTASRTNNEAIEKLINGFHDREKTVKRLEDKVYSQMDILSAAREVVEAKQIFNSKFTNYLKKEK